MGCDFYYKGCLPDNKAQEDVVELAKQFFEVDGRIVVPEPELKSIAEIELEEPTQNKSRGYTPTPTVQESVFPFEFTV